MHIHGEGLLTPEQLAHVDPIADAAGAEAVLGDAGALREPGDKPNS
jgi:hypothetical protein